MKVVTVQEMRAIEQSSVDHGVSLDELQLNAAAAIADRLDRTAGPHLFLVGPGNNGRDALIAAAMLAEAGGEAWAYLAPKVASEDVRERLMRAGGEIAQYEADESLGSLRGLLQKSSVVVDGLLGIGIRGAAREPVASIIAAADEVCQRRRVPVVAVDLPSGIDADSGEVPGPALHATATLSLGCVKAGLLIPPAVDYVGSLVLLEIGLPPETYSSIRSDVISPGDVASILPPRPLAGHKGTFGRVLVVAGSVDFVGAPYLVGAAAARSGCGIVTLAVPAWQRMPLVTLIPEATYLPLVDNTSLEAARENASAVARLLPQCDALAVGPGLGQGDAQTELVMSVLETARGIGNLRVIVDADALNALAAVPEWWQRIGGDLVITPHPGEMGRLLGISAGEVNRNRLRIAREAAAKWGRIVVLKGAYTVVASPEGRLWVNPAAMPALGTGGSGDVLSGMIAGLMAQGCSAVDAAHAAVYLHSSAAEGVLEQAEVDRLLASDLLPEIPRAMKRVLASQGR